MTKRITRPEMVEDVAGAFEKRNIVIYRTDGTDFILNPFGGGQSATGEHRLVDGWEVTGEKLQNITIVELD